MTKQNKRCWQLLLTRLRRKLRFYHGRAPTCVHCTTQRHFFNKNSNLAQYEHKKYRPVQIKPNIMKKKWIPTDRPYFFGLGQPYQIFLFFCLIYHRHAKQSHTFNYLRGNHSQDFFSSWPFDWSPLGAERKVFWRTNASAGSILL